MNPENLTVWECPFQKFRLGEAHDGGYVLCHLPGVEYGLLLSGGIGAHCTFEDHMIERYPSLVCEAFDGSVSMAPTRYPARFHFHSQNIGTDDSTNLKSIIRKHKTIFLKLDIEGDEFPWFDCLEPELMERFAQIVIEFHDPFGEVHDKIFQKINKTHVLVHLHGNNYAPVKDYCGNPSFPTVFECCYLHKQYLGGLELRKNTTPLPCPIDKANAWGWPDISLNCPPFCFPAAEG